MSSLAGTNHHIDSHVFFIPDAALFRRSLFPSSSPILESSVRWHESSGNLSGHPFFVLNVALDLTYYRHFLRISVW